MTRKNTPGSVDLFIMGVMAVVIIAQYVGIVTRDEKIANYKEMLNSLPVDVRDENGAPVVTTFSTEKGIILGANTSQMLTNPCDLCYHNNREAKKRGS